MTVANDAARDGGGMYTRNGCVIILLGFSSYAQQKTLVEFLSILKQLNFL